MELDIQRVSAPKTKPEPYSTNYKREILIPLKMREVKESAHDFLPCIDRRARTNIRDPGTNPRVRAARVNDEGI